MSASTPFFVLIMLLHLGIFVTSPHADKLKRLLMALGLTSLSIPMVVIGFQLDQVSVEGQLSNNAAMVLLNAPYYLPIVAFLVYIRRWR